jgi:hypothetical protein
MANWQARRPGEEFATRRFKALVSGAGGMRAACRYVFVYRALTTDKSGLSSLAGKGGVRRRIGRSRPSGRD